MRTRFALTLASLSLIAVACGAEPVAADAVTLRYGLEPGYELSYDVNQTADMTMVVQGGGADLFGAGLGNTSMQMDVDLVVGYDVAEGPDPDTVEIKMRTKVAGGAMTIDAAGFSETLSLDDIPEATEELEVEIVMVVGPTGDVRDLTVAGQPIPLDLFGDSFGLFGQGFQTPGFFGPVLPDRPVAPGDTWKTDDSTSVLGLEFEVRGSHTYAADETLAGRSVARIESKLRMDAVDIDLIEMLQEMLASPGISEYAGADAEEMDMAMALFEALGMEMRMKVAKTTTDITTWFDPADGTVVRSVTSQPMSVTMTMDNVPEMGGPVRIDMEMEATTTMELAG